MRENHRTATKKHMPFSVSSPLSPPKPPALSPHFSPKRYSDLNGGTREGEGHSPRQRKNTLFLCLVGHIFWTPPPAPPRYPGRGDGCPPQKCIPTGYILLVGLKKAHRFVYIVYIYNILYIDYRQIQYIVLKSKKKEG